MYMFIDLAIHQSTNTCNQMNYFLECAVQHCVREIDS